MEPKFQSSFIPKGPLATQGAISRVHKKEKSFFGIIGTIVFILTLLAAASVFGYAQFLKYRISKMSSDLEAARAAIDPGVIRELTRTDARLRSTQELLSRHVAMSPLFDYLEASTLRSVRLTALGYGGDMREGLNLTLKGQARGYASLSLQSDEFAKSVYIKDPIFSDLTLDDKGNVAFSFSAKLDPSMTLFKRDLAEREQGSVAPTVTTNPSSTTTSQAQ
jgi:hypothetical protein